MINSFRKFWRGELTLRSAFWLYGVLGFTLLGIIANFLVDRLLSWGAVFYFFAVLFFVIGLSYLIVVLVAVWRSASRYGGRRVWSFLARSVVVVVTALNIYGIGEVGYLYFVRGMNDPGRTSYNVANLLVPTLAQPYIGLWKTACPDNFGLAIASSENGLYSVSFCGPTGCFKPGTYRPNTSLVGDSNYNIIDVNTIDVLTKEGWVRYYRCTKAKSEDVPSVRSPERKR